MIASNSIAPRFQACQGGISKKDGSHPGAQIARLQIGREHEAEGSVISQNSRRPTVIVPPRPRYRIEI